jgi:ubiquitin carboxyl-terminal hydrolase 8
MLGINNESTTDRSPKDWFERALRESELAILAERKQRKEDMFLCYTKACHFYTNTKMHPDFAAVRKSDPNWGTRVKDFREVSHQMSTLNVR